MSKRKKLFLVMQDPACRVFLIAHVELALTVLGKSPESVPIVKQVPDSTNVIHEFKQHGWQRFLVDETPRLDSEVCVFRTQQFRHLDALPKIKPLI